MSLKDTIQNDIKTALLGGNRFAGEVLRGLKAALLNEEVAQGVRDSGLSDADAEKVIAREVKKRREAATMYRQNDREDLAENEDAEAAIIEQYLPEQMSEDDLRALVQQQITELGASGSQAMGQVIGAVKQQAGTSADGAVVARIVREELAR